ncbi:MAG: nitrate reductase [Methylococcales bacterium]|jgi:nitrate reductase gamma subunit|nr:nitrate reductase [Methylococcales bacterium]
MILSSLFALLFLFAVAVLVLGTAYKIKQYINVPAPLKIPTTPAPTTKSGVVWRLFREVVFFESLFKSTKWTWIFSWIFHMSMFVVLARHIRYFNEPVWSWVALIQPFGIYAGFTMIIGMLGLLARRIFVDRVKYISSPSDYIMLLLILSIGATGLLMKFVEHTDIVTFKAFIQGIITFNWQPLPTDPLLLVHLMLVIILMIIFPFSKLLHAPGIFFSPTRNQVDNPREQRHIAKWAEKFETSDGQ